MSEEVQAPQEEETPVETAPVEDTPSPVVDYEQRYNNLRPEFDRTRQQLRDYEERLAAYENSQPDDEPEYEYEYEDPVARQKIAQLEALIQQQQDETRQQREAQERINHISQEIQTLEKEVGDEFTDEEFDLLGQISANTLDEDGNPDVRVAYEKFSKILDGRRSKWVSTKKAPKVSAGPPAAEIPDLDNPGKRAEYFEQRMKDIEAQEGF